jgi:hypothetical protein
LTAGYAKKLIKTLPKKPQVVAIGWYGDRKARTFVYLIKEFKRIGMRLLLDA